MLCLTGLYLFNSCQKNEEHSPLKPASKYDEIGTVHNEGLEFVLNSLKVDTKSSDTHSFPTIGTMEALCQSFAQSKGYDPATTRTNAGEMDTLVRQTPDFAELGASDRTLCYIEKFETMLSNKKIINIVNLQQIIRDFEWSVNKDSHLSPEEKDILLYMSAVARYSAEYWNKNYEKWAVELRGIDYWQQTSCLTRSGGGENGSNWLNTVIAITWSDAGGAAAGALATAATGGLAAGTIVAAGLGGSVYAAWEKLCPSIPDKDPLQPKLPIPEHTM